MNKRQLTKWRENYTVWEMPCLGEGLHLHVHFDEKDDVKRLGGRWNPDPSGKGGHWWMPKDKLHGECPIPCELMGDGWSGTIEDWLNNHKMIAGQYGTLDVGYCEDAIFGEDGDNLIKYELTNGDASITMSVYPRLAIVRCVSTQGNNFLNLSDARNVWDSLIQTGYRKVVRHEETV